MPKPVEQAKQARRRLALALMTLALLLGAGCTARPGTTEEPISSGPPSSPTVKPTSTPEPLVPTSTSVPIAPTGSASATKTLVPTLALPQMPTETRPGATETIMVAAASPSPSPSATSSLRTTPTVAGTVASVVPPPTGIPVPQGRGRLGVGVAFGSISEYPVEASGLGIGWYLNWGVQEHPTRPAGADFWQMVRVAETGYRPGTATIRAAAAANPGSFWLIGNEPDVRWQDNTTPERYAELYHELYHLLKSADPLCHVVIGGVSQPTPLRMAYLERILTAYRGRYGTPMPVDVWNVHGFILREERDSWGVDIPPGMQADTGALYEIEDHDDLTIFRSQLLAFRRWMASHGQRDKPLVVSEYGILMPGDYGFGTAELQRFLVGSFDVLLTAVDHAVGYPQDGDRLVQWWCWYSLAAPDDYYPTGNLFDPVTKSLTPLGTAFAAYPLP